MGVILAMAGARDHRYVVQTQSYGPEARGGYSRSDVIISDAPIDYPELEQADLLVALSQAAADEYIGVLRSDGVLVYDSENVTALPAFKGERFGIPFTRLALEETGRTQTTNILTLGAVAGITGVVTTESLRKAVLAMVPAGTEEMNSKGSRPRTGARRGRMARLPPSRDRGGVRMIVAGIDVGAKNVHAVLIEEGRVVAKAAVASGFDHEESAERGLQEAARAAGIERGAIGAIAATGAGRKALAFAGQQPTEVAADGTGRRGPAARRPHGHRRRRRRSPGHPAEPRGQGRRLRHQREVRRRRRRLRGGHEPRPRHGAWTTSPGPRSTPPRPSP